MNATGHRRHREAETTPAPELGVADLLTRFAEQPGPAMARAIVERLDALSRPAAPGALPGVAQRRYTALLARWRVILAEQEGEVVRRRVPRGNPFA